MKIKNRNIPLISLTYNKVNVIYYCFLITVFSLSSISSSSQSISGFVYDEENTPIPFANIYIKNLQNGTSTDVKGRYFYQFSDDGLYEIVITAVGFKNQEHTLIINGNKTQVKNIWLKQDVELLNEIVINSKQKDPAYEIIKKAIQKREFWKTQILSSKSKVYIKGKEIISKKEKKRRNRKRKEQQKQQENELKVNVDVFEKKENQKEIRKIANSLNMLEINMSRDYEYPNKVKETRTAYKKYGNIYSLFFTNTIENDFNFYYNLMQLPKLNEVPIVSPLNNISAITYKFKLDETTFTNGKMLYKIKVIPRKKGNATFKGYIWILEETFNIQKVDLSLHKGGLLMYTDFNIKQEYSFNKDSILILEKQEFNYKSNTRKKKFVGNTIVNYSDYEINKGFKKKHFSNEVGVTTKEAYKRDSSYWDKIRPEPLTKEEQKYQHIKDSLYDLTHSEVYLDSIDSVFNKVSFLNIVWDGVYFTNRKKKRYWGVTSLAGMIDPFEIAGVRFGPEATFFKKFENEQYISLRGQLNTSYQNWDLKGYLSAEYRYNPMNRGIISLYTGRQFDLIVLNDALSSLFERNNWIENDFVILRHSREIFNGLSLGTSLSLSERRSIEKYNFSELTDSLFGGNTVSPFQTYQTTKIGLTLSYTPFQKFLREPYRKVILGSKWPTFLLSYSKGISGLFKSDINFDYLEGEIKQSFKLSSLGTSSYKLSGGKFINTNDLRYPDAKIFPRGDKWFFASLMQSMQIQDTTLVVTNSFLKAHYTHHFNGAIINFIPLIKKLGIHAVVGSSALHIPESNYNYLEGFLGVERTFKIDRRRLRLGVYAVDAMSNRSEIAPRIKFAINFYNMRDNSWGY